ncbi:MAG: VWA domain-containing protein, partial [Opitutae bacterium]|nr:VWA domain-containing protein [Opitutae bacterium]
RVSGDRLGLITFHVSAFLRCPLTLDHHAFTKTLKDLEIGFNKTTGTDLASPIKEAIYSFSSDDTDRFLILLSDGEDLEGQGLQKAKEAAKLGVKIFVIGIGSKAGGRIPTDPIDQVAKNFHRDPEGQTIVTKLDQDSLKSIARATGGNYYSLGPTGEGLAKVFENLQSIGQQKRREQLSTELPIDRYHLFVVFGFVFLCIEMLTMKIRKRNISQICLIVSIFTLLLPGCFKQDNVKRAEEALASGEPNRAADFFMAEIKAYEDTTDKIDPRLYLNAGLAFLDAGQLDKSEKSLEDALGENLDDPHLQAKALNALGNISYQRANQFLDKRNVKQARIAWEQARGYYEKSIGLSENDKAKQNLLSLNQQIQERINALISKISGKVWRDLNGDGKPQKKEPNLKGYVFWDKDQNGEHNKSNEPAVQTDENGFFSFEWISDQYPISLRIGTQLIEANQSKNDFLIPMLPPPPPPESSENIKNYYLNLEQPGEKVIGIPYRSAPTLQGVVWRDENGNGEQDSNDRGFSSAQLFIDQNGNFQLDENETAFEPSEDGTFIQPVPPGQYSLCVQPKNPDANVTFPFEAEKAYLAWTDFESPSVDLNFGIQDNSEQEQNSSAPQNQPPPKVQENQDSNSTNSLPEDVNALYERLLQEMESKSKPLDQEIQVVEPTSSGRDY